MSEAYSMPPFARFFSATGFKVVEIATIRKSIFREVRPWRGLMKPDFRHAAAIHTNAGRVPVLVGFADEYSEHGRDGADY